MEHKYFQGKKYYLDNRGYWFSTAQIGRTKLCHDVWNFFFPNDQIIPGDGQVIHHINENKSDDNILNLEKMAKKKHHSLHSSGDKNANYGKTGKDHPGWKDIPKHKMLYLGGGTKNKRRYEIVQWINSLDELGISSFVTR